MLIGDNTPIVKINDMTKLIKYKPGLYTLSTLLALVLILSGCKKDYYTDTGKHDGKFNGTVMDYLSSKPEHFDTLVRVIKLAGLENVLRNENITFFAPADSCIRATIYWLNQELESRGLSRVVSINQIKPAVWRKHLAKYIFKEKRSMNDFPQLDYENLSAFPGQIYSSYDGTLMNIGVYYADAGGVRYAGPRTLRLSFLSSTTTPLNYLTWFSSIVSSVNIEPTNGYVHVLSYVFHFFGFTPFQFADDAIAAGLN